jgi:hypothetical protein
MVYKTGGQALYATTLIVGKSAGGVLLEDQPTDLSVELRDSRTGKAVADIVNWLGMPAHAIIASENLRSFQHAHGMPSSSGMASPGSSSGHSMGHDMGDMGGMAPGAKPSAFVFSVKFPSAGRYKMWVQFQRGNELSTAPIVLVVSSK